MDINSATSTIDRDFDTFDTALQNDIGKVDGKISQEDLQTVADNRDGRFTDEQQQAAQFALDSKATNSFLDVGAGKGRVDGTISREDIDGALATLASGSYFDELLDTGAGKGSRDGNISSVDIAAVLSDPGIPQDIKDTINVLLLAPEGSDGLHEVLKGVTADEVGSDVRHLESVGAQRDRAGQFERVPGAAGLGSTACTREPAYSRFWRPWLRNRVAYAGAVGEFRGSGQCHQDIRAEPSAELSRNRCRRKSGSGD